MNIDLKAVHKWYAEKIGKQVPELDAYDLFCAKVAYDYACEQLNQADGKTNKKRIKELNV